MKQTFITQRGSTDLMLFFAGWGMDEHLTDCPTETACDCMLCYDYHDLNFDTSPLARYRHFRVAAWSMGVWVAGQTLHKHALSPERCMAFNGTNFPIDDERGIPAAVFRGTLGGFSVQTWEKFQRRMCSTAGSLLTFKAHAPTRPLTSLRSELTALRDAIAGHGPSAWKWDKAVIGLRDRIFPTENQQRAWEGTPHITADVAHYDARLLHDLINGKEELWTNS